MINAEWHARNKMPKNPTEAHRLAWHLVHADKCGCRELTPKLKQTLEQNFKTLLDNKEALAKLVSYPVSHVREYLDYILEAKKLETRQERVEKLVAQLT